MFCFIEAVVGNAGIIALALTSMLTGATDEFQCKPVAWIIVIAPFTCCLLFCTRYTRTDIIRRQDGRTVVAIHVLDAIDVCAGVLAERRSAA